jgi:hypothetical protein
VSHDDLTVWEWQGLAARAWRLWEDDLSGLDEAGVGRGLGVRLRLLHALQQHASRRTAATALTSLLP